MSHAAFFFSSSSSSSSIVQPLTLHCSSMYCRWAPALLRLARGVSQAPHCGFAAAAARYTGDQSDSLRPGGEVSSLWLSQPGTTNVIKCEKNLINDAKLRLESDRLFVYNGTSKQNMYTYFYLR